MPVAPVIAPEILRALEARGVMTIAALAGALQFHHEPIRRCLAGLAEAGKVVVHREHPKPARFALPGADLPVVLSEWQRERAARAFGAWFAEPRVGDGSIYGMVIRQREAA